MNVLVCWYLYSLRRLYHLYTEPAAVLEQKSQQMDSHRGPPTSRPAPQGRPAPSPSQLQQLRDGPLDLGHEVDQQGPLEGVPVPVEDGEQQVGHPTHGVVYISEVDPDWLYPDPDPQNLINPDPGQ